MKKMLSLVLYTVLYCLSDYVLQKYGFEGRYYFNHFVANTLVAIYCFNDLLRAYDLKDVLLASYDYRAITMVSAIHMYHIIFYYKYFKRDDWLHHVLMIFFALPLAVAMNQVKLINHSLFFLSGFPGGVNYALLFLQRNGYLTRERQKQINKHLNIWVRQPGCIATCVLIIIGLYNFTEYETYQKVVGFLICLVVYWNGNYFMEQVVSDFAKRYSYRKFLGIALE